AGVADGPLVHHVPRDSGDVLFAEPFETREVKPRMRRHAWHPLRVLAAEDLVAAPDHHGVAGLDAHALARRRRVQLARGHRLAEGVVSLLPPRRHVEKDAAGGDAVEQRVDGAPGGAGGGEALHEGPAVVELAVPRDVTER